MRLRGADGLRDEKQRGALLFETCVWRRVAGARGMPPLRLCCSLSFNSLRVKRKKKKANSKPCLPPSSPGASSRRSPAPTAPWPRPPLPLRRRRQQEPLPRRPSAGALRRCPRSQTRTASRRRRITTRKTAAALRAGFASLALSATTGRE